MLEKVFLLNMPNFLQERNPHILFIHLYKSKVSLLKMFLIYIAFNATYTNTVHLTNFNCASRYAYISF